MSFDKPPVNKVEQKKTPEERDQIYKKLLEELKVGCPTLDSFYKEINEHGGKPQAISDNSGSPSNPFYLARAFSAIYGEIRTRVESPNSGNGEVTLSTKQYYDIARLKQIVDARAANVYFGQDNIINENGLIPRLADGFVDNFSNYLK